MVSVKRPRMLGILNLGGPARTAFSYNRPRPTAGLDLAYQSSLPDRVVKRAATLCEKLDQDREVSNPPMAAHDTLCGMWMALPHPKL